MSKDEWGKQRERESRENWWAKAGKNLMCSRKTKLTVVGNVAWDKVGQSRWEID